MNLGQKVLLALYAGDPDRKEDGKEVNKPNCEGVADGSIRTIFKKLRGMSRGTGQLTANSSQGD